MPPEDRRRLEGGMFCIITGRAEQLTTNPRKFRPARAPPLIEWRLEDAITEITRKECARKTTQNDVLLNYLITHLLRRSIDSE